LLSRLKKKLDHWMRCELNELTHQRMRIWFTRIPGRWFQAEERAQLAEVLPNLFGYHLLQLGDLYSRECLTSTRIPHCVVLDSWMSDKVPLGERNRDCVRGTPEYLPIDADCLDVVLLPHTLEFTENPHQILREVDRILIPEGHVVVLGFNPWSLWFLWYLVLGWRGKPPWCGRFIRQARLNDWLELLGFDIVNSRRYFYRPPLTNKPIMKRLRFLDRICRRWCPNLGAGYIVVARKRVATLTPIPQRWRPKPITKPELAGNSSVNGRAGTNLDRNIEKPQI
jgi:SAM-dependent methyltransferase